MKRLATAFLESAQNREDSVAFITTQNALTFRLISQLANIVQNKLLLHRLPRGARICIYVTRAEWNTIIPLAASGSGLAICFGDPESAQAAGLKIDLVITDIQEYARQHMQKSMLIDGSWFSHLDAPLRPLIGQEFRIAFSSSGSTGVPKYIERGEEEFCNLVDIKCHTFKRAKNPRLLVTHGEAGMWCLSERIAAMLSGQTNVVSSRDFESTLHAIDRNAVNVLATTPSFLNNLLATKFQFSLLQSVEEIFVGGAIVSPELLRRVSEITAAQVIISYGSIEMSRNATKSITNFDFTDGCVGTPLANCEIQIFDEAGKPCVKGKQGEVAIRNPLVLKNMNYTDTAQGSASQFRDGWFFPGDLGYFKDGELYISGRTNEVINIGGNKIAPETIELALIHSGLVKNAGAVPTTGKLGVDELNVAYVSEVDRSVDELNEALSKAKLKISINKANRCTTMPMTEAGKVDKAAVRKMFGGTP